MLSFRYKSRVEDSITKITAKQHALVMYANDVAFDPAAPLNGLYLGKILACVSLSATASLLLTSLLGYHEDLRRQEQRRLWYIQAR
jgi:hypothetical protein